jgi:hypothetical protein
VLLGAAPGPPPSEEEARPVVLLGAASGPPPKFGVVEALRERGLRYCQEADSVVEGFLCNEPTVVSSACRKPGNAFDAYVCDEPRMRELQKSVIRETLSILKTLLIELLRS